MSGLESKIDELMSSPEIRESLKGVKKIGDITAPGGPLQIMMKRVIDGIAESERDQFLGYCAGSRSDKKTSNNRNGYSKKTVKTTLGEVTLDVPRDREGSFYPTLLEKYKQLDPELEKKIFRLYAKGMSTRDIEDVIGDIYGTDVSSTLVSQATNKIQGELLEWQTRALRSVYTVLYFDAIFFNSREEGKVVKKASYTCYAIDVEGQVDILGIWLSQGEGSRFWMSILNELKDRGVEDILIACVDGLKGFPEAIENIFPKTEVQLCVVHQIRNSSKYVSSKNLKSFLVSLKAVYGALSLEDAELALVDLEEKWGDKYPSAVNPWRANWKHLSAFFKYPSEVRKMIYTTNIVENMHRQFRKVMKSKSSFPNDDALKKMLFLVIQDYLKKDRKKKNWSVVSGQLAAHFEERMR